MLDSDQWANLLLQVKKDGYESKAFRTLFEEVKTLLRQYIASKGMNPNNFEDELQEFFSKPFFTSIEHYDSSFNTKFSTYVIGLFWKKFITYRIQNERYRMRHVLALNEPLENASHERIHNLTDHQETTLYGYVKEEIKQFLLDGINQIQSDRMRLSLYFKFCLPVRLQHSELADFLGMTTANFNSSLYKGLQLLKEWVDSNKDTVGFDYSDVSLFFKQDSLTVTWEDLFSHPDKEIALILKTVLTDRNSSINRKGNEYPTKETKWSKPEIHHAIKEGILWAIQQQKISLRGGSFMAIKPIPSEENVIGFLDHLSSASSFQQRSASEFTASTTGNEEWDSFLQAIQWSFSTDEQPESFSEQFANQLVPFGMSIEGFAQRFHYSDQEVMSVIANEADDALIQRIKNDLKEL